MHLSNLIDEIYALESIEELRRVRRALDSQWKAIERSIKCSFIINEHVGFQSSKGWITGRIKKINRKNVKIEQDNSNTLWTVSPSLLKSL